MGYRRAAPYLQVANALIGAGALSACASAPQAAPPFTATVAAVGQTEPVGTAAQDAADDPAIWRNPRQPERSLVIGTDKKAGLHVYGMDGRSRDFVAAGRLNNVDLIDLEQNGIIVAASDRNDVAHARVQFYRLEAEAEKLVPLGGVPAGSGEAYGICLAQLEDRLYVFSVLKDGTITQVHLDLSGPTPRGEIVRTLHLRGQGEGCVVDPRSATLYVGEEARGIWAYDARPDAPAKGALVAVADGVHLVADVEGLALVPMGEREGFLIASSQGDNAFALYTLPTMRAYARFRISGGALGATEETDGIAYAAGGFGPGYPNGLFVAQDGQNGTRPQNFKFVSWQDVLAALEPAR